MDCVSRRLGWKALNDDLQPEPLSGIFRRRGGGSHARYALLIFT